MREQHTPFAQPDQHLAGGTKFTKGRNTVVIGFRTASSAQSTMPRRSCSAIAAPTKRVDPESGIAHSRDRLVSR